jgi:hypothetical protein
VPEVTAAADEVAAAAADPVAAVALLQLQWHPLLLWGRALPPLLVALPRPMPMLPLELWRKRL